MYKNIAKQHQDIQSINTMFQAILQQTENTPFIVDQKRKRVVVYNYPTKDTIKYCPFSEITPEVLSESGVLSEDSLDEYKKIYQNVVVEGKVGEPVIIHSRKDTEKEWLRVSIISNALTDSSQMIGVLEGYSEQKEKDMQIEIHLDDIKKIKKKSQTNFLTNLYNRETFITKVETILQENLKNPQRNAFLILDLDHFKDVNDCMGHAMGDVVLQNTAEILRNFFRKEDIVGCLGGDEFIIFCTKHTKYHSI